MDFEPSEDQRLLVESVTRMLGDTYGFAQRKSYMGQAEGYAPAIWSQFAELGLLGLPFAEEYGGFGGGAQEVMLVMQAFGRALVLEPFLSTVVLAGTAVNRAGSAQQKQAILPAIAEGRLKMAFAHGERQARYDLNDVVTTAKRDGSGWVLDGSKTVVSHGEAADKLIVSARTGGDRHDEDGITLFLVDAQAPGVARRGYLSRDDTRAADIALSNVSVPDADVLGEVGHGLPIVRRVVEAGIAATAGETVGAMEAMNEMTLEYSKTRVQFGQPIGSYQVVQHRLADMFMTQEQGRSMAMLATMSVDNPDDAARTHDIALAKVGIGQAGRYVSQSAVQMHGGIGMTEEYAVGHYFRRCMVIERLFGDPAYYLAKLAAEVR
ncbi:acyl-CoA dehydrogenase family protein [Rhodopila globiformis]|uniref:Pimeloyl-CoA dehydrogenase small subunit n=1 Tax=Rhodopila globiformis TaxID=1071 RepID=A0A2S6N384_RHOGL|nr:acyl-CoA dehydrogenase family protein [Rhodopila globiformis]PPQ29069.1 pimeloyl-CoA dehydrogenase small subunit [Rhodopila globiformis]